jgi:hypothetical protein
MQNPYDTSATNIPPALASLLSAGSTSSTQPSMAPMAAGLSGSMGMQGSPIPSYQAGGMIGAGGMPESPNVGLAPQGQPQGAAMSPQMMEMQQRTLSAPRIPGFSKLHPVIDGCW